MSGDRTETVVAKGLLNGALGFMKKPTGAEDLRDLWQYIHDLKKDSENDKKFESMKIAAAVPENNNDSNGSKKIAAVPENNNNSNGSKKIAAVPENNNNSNGGTTGQSKKDLKRPATTTRNVNTEEKKGKGKKAKLVWTTNLHYRFLDALSILQGKESKRSFLRN